LPVPLQAAPSHQAQFLQCPSGPLLFGTQFQRHWN
jgi:hypothetical protein